MISLHIDTPIKVPMHRSNMKLLLYMSWNTTCGTDKTLRLERGKNRHFSTF